MRAGAIMAGAAAALALVVLPSVASAQTRAQGRASTVSAAEAQAAQSAGTRATPQQRRGLTLNESGRWGLDFNVSPPQGRESSFGDVEAGAYYRVSPRLQVGASAGLDEPEADPVRPAQPERRSEPRFRLESIFRF